MFCGEVVGFGKRFLVGVLFFVLFFVVWVGFVLFVCLGVGRFVVIVF